MWSCIPNRVLFVHNTAEVLCRSSGALAVSFSLSLKRRHSVVKSLTVRITQNSRISLSKCDTHFVHSILINLQLDPKTLYVYIYFWCGYLALAPRTAAANEGSRFPKALYYISEYRWCWISLLRGSWKTNIFRFCLIINSFVMTLSMIYFCSFIRLKLSCFFRSSFDFMINQQTVKMQSRYVWATITPTLIFRIRLHYSVHSK